MFRDVAVGCPESPPMGERERQREPVVVGTTSCTQPWGYIHLSLPCTSGSLSFCHLCIPLLTNHFPALLAGLFVLLGILISDIWCLCGNFQRQSLENNPVPCRSQQGCCGSCRAKRVCGGLGEGKLCPQRSEEWD